MPDELRTALVSGGGTGIGRATALRMAEAGYAVGIAGRRNDPLRIVADEIAAGGGRAVAVSAEVGTEEGAARAVAAVVGEFGRLDSLVCNHGVGDSYPVGDETLERWESALRINLTGPFLLARAALPHLIEVRGSIVTVSSTSGRFAGPGWASYCASKAGLSMLTRCLANDYGHHGVRANCVCPGWVRTPMGEEDMAAVAEAWNTSVDDAYWLCSRETPLLRPAEPEEIAGGDRVPGRPRGQLRQRGGDPGRRRRHRGRRVLHAVSRTRGKAAGDTAVAIDPIGLRLSAVNPRGDP